MSLASVRGIPRWPVNSPHKGPETRKMLPFDDVIMSIDRRRMLQGCWAWGGYIPWADAPDGGSLWRHSRVEVLDGVEISDRIRLDSFTVPLHSPNGRQLPAVRAAQRDCHWGLNSSWNSHWSREPIMQWGTGQSQSIFRPTNYKRVMPANWTPYLKPHWRSYCHQARTV